MKVEVRPLDTVKWHGKKNKENFTRPKTIRALVDAYTNEYATGLTNEDILKLEKEGIKYDLSPHYSSDEPHPFWDSNMATIKLENRTMIFDSDKSLDKIKISIMKASKFVANSLEEYSLGHYPEATHVIFDEEEEIEIKAKKVELKKSLILKTAELSKDRKIQLILLLSDKNLKGKSDNFIEVELDKLIENEPKDLLMYINKHPEQLAAESIVVEALQKNILVKDGHRIKFYDSVIGTEILEVANYLLKTENQALKATIMNKLYKE